MKEKRPNMKVYVVSAGQYDDSHVAAVLSDEASAKALASLMHGSVSVFRLDEESKLLAMALSGRSYYVVRLSLSSGVVLSCLSEPWCKMDDVGLPTPYSYTAHQQDYFVVECWAASDQEARDIAANEWRHEGSR